MRLAIIGLLLVASGCGKVGDPLPPYIRIPEPARDLSVGQRGYDLVFTWTNPSRNVDGSGSADLARALLMSGDSTVAAIPVNSAGQRQSFTFPARPLVGISKEFELRIETTRGKVSESSNRVSITAVDVPEKIMGVRAIVDQRRIFLEWDPPPDNSQLADGYFVFRSGQLVQPAPVTIRRIEDPAFDAGQTYAYLVVAARRAEHGWVQGVSGPALTVTATDRIPPRRPAGLLLTRSDTGGFLTWHSNQETDLAGYRVFRSEKHGGEFGPISEKILATNAFFDPGYRSGLYYAVSAIDESGNESRLSEPLRAP